MNCNISVTTSRMARKLTQNEPPVLTGCSRLNRKSGYCGELLVTDSYKYSF